MDFSSAIGRAREKQILGIVRPRPWWMPRFAWRYLLRRLVVIAIVNKRVPITFGPLELRMPMTPYRPGDFLAAEMRYALPKPDVPSLYLTTGLGPERAETR